MIKPYIKGAALEVGAGIGTNTSLFHTDNTSSWTMLEPDNHFFTELQKLVAANKLPANCTALYGYTNDLEEKEVYDCILYIDVLEHIENDKTEIEIATTLLKKSGHLVVLSPAHNFLMSPFDKAIGHYRRYSKNTLAATANQQLQPEKIIYTDCVGFFASLANKLFLRQQYPTKQQIYFWDKWLVPLSSFLDSIFFYTAGKTVIGIWKKI